MPYKDLGRSRLPSGSSCQNNFLAALEDKPLLYESSLWFVKLFPDTSIACIAGAWKLYAQKNGHTMRNASVLSCKHYFQAHVTWAVTSSSLLMFLKKEGNECTPWRHLYVLANAHNLSVTMLVSTQTMWNISISTEPISVTFRALYGYHLFCA